MNTATKLAIGSIIVGFVVLGAKLLAWWVTGSVALLSDALESTVNIVASVAVLLALRVAAKPADENHPFGHNKAEYFSAVLEGVLIVVAALLIIHSAWPRLFDPTAIENPYEGLGISLIAGAANCAWAWVLRSQGRKLKSPALVADSAHLMADVWTTFGVAFGLVLAVLTGWTLLDPLLALVVAINVLWSGWKVIQSSLSSLMDEALPPDELAKVHAIIQRSAHGALQAHDVHTRQAGQVAFIEFHLVVDGDMSVSESHDICDRIEREIKAEMGEARVNIHVEPRKKAKPDALTVSSE